MPCAMLIMSPDVKNVMAKHSKPVFEFFNRVKRPIFVDFLVDRCVRMLPTRVD